MRGLACAALVLQAACSSVYPPLPPPASHPPIRALSIVASIAPMEVRTTGAEHRQESAFGECLSGLGGAGCSGDFCGAVLFIGLVACSVVGVVGAASGPSEAPPNGEQRLSESLKNTVSHDLNEALRDAVIATARMRGTPLVQDHVTGDAGRPDVTLEVGITQINVSGKGNGGPVALKVMAEANVRRAGELTAEKAKTYLFVSGHLSLEAWLADGGKRIRESLQRSVVALGAHVHDYALFHYPLPDRSPQLSGFLAATFGLEPLEPKPRGTTVTDDAASRLFAWPAVDSLRPTFRWSPFPRPGDMSADPENMGRVSNVRYDLVIAEEQGFSAGEIVYRRDELALAEHPLEHSLAPDRRYFWSVRARFDLDGQTRFTEWGNMSFPMRERVTAPSDDSYRFRTP